IHRPIETVISYSASQQDRLRAEIAEYHVTESIEEQLEKLLTGMQLAMEGGGPSQVAVWVSGFYGSGKTSFTKYLGLALDESVKVDGEPGKGTCIFLRCKKMHFPFSLPFPFFSLPGQHTQLRTSAPISTSLPTWV